MEWFIFLNSTTNLISGTRDRTDVNRAATLQSVSCQIKGIFPRSCSPFQVWMLGTSDFTQFFPLNLNLHICWELDYKHVKNSSACQEIKLFFCLNLIAQWWRGWHSLFSGCALLYLIAYPMANNLEVKLNASSYTLGRFISVKSYSSIPQNEHMGNKTLVKVKVLIY